MTRYDSDRQVKREPFDWDGFIAKHKIGNGLRSRYRVIPLDLPLTGDDVHRIRQGSISESMSDKWDIVFLDNVLVCFHSWTGICHYLIRLSPEGDGYRIRDVLENCNPRHSNGYETSAAYGSGWALAELGSLIDGYRFEWQLDSDFQAWSWYDPPKQSSRKIRRLAKRMPSIRSAFQRSVLSDLNKYEVGYRVPLRLGKRTRNRWCFRFAGITPAIEGAFIAHDRNYYQVVIQVKHSTASQPILALFKCAPHRDNCGIYVDRIAEMQKRWCRYPSLEVGWTGTSSIDELWGNQLLGPLATWIDEKLAPANWLVLIECDGASSAYLAVERPELQPGQIVMPLRVGS